MTDPAIDPTLAALRRGDLAGATTLRLRCGLSEFPREILGLADTLELLDLGGNPLSALPADLGRLRRLRVLFCSGTRIRVLPPSLGDCAVLSQVGFRDTGLEEIPAESLPPALRWLTVTGNRLQRLPDAIGRRPALQKLMLAGNRLADLPGSLAGAGRLELLRVSANRFDRLPGWLAGLPRLAWLALAGNPAVPDRPTPQAPVLDWNGLWIGNLLGEGASGRVFRASGPDGTAMALKLFRGALTSDGTPEHEMAAALAAGSHPALVGALARLRGHPDGLAGLALTLLPGNWRALAGPPSLAGCTRDEWDPLLRLPPRTALALARGAAEAGAHLHGAGLLHGDLYAHNLLWDPGTGRCRLSDLGAASFPAGPMAPALLRTDVLAWGILAGELLERCAEPDALAALAMLRDRCLSPDPMARPDFAALVAALDRPEAR